jgi:RNA polymerase sigma factor (sigma-70 family)
LTDEELIALLKRSQEAGFRAAFSLYGRKVYHVAYGFLQNKEEAEDIVQEVFIELFRSLRMFRGESALSTWVYRVSVNKSLELIRSKKRKKRWAFLLSTGDPSFKEKSHPQADTQADTQLLHDENKKLLHEAIGRLPENQKVAFTLHKIEGMKHQQVAEVMDVTVTAVESLVHRAKSNLKKSIMIYLKD